MKKLFGNKKGETLVEVLAAILVFTLSSIILYSMVTTASSVNMKAQAKDEAVQNQTKIAEYALEGKTEGEVILTMRKNDGSVIQINGKDSISIPVFIFKDEADDSLYTYYAQ